MRETSDEKSSMKKVKYYLRLQSAIVGKKVSLIKLPIGVFFFFLIVDIRSRLVEIKFRLISKHLMDDPDQFASTVPESIILNPAF